MNHLPAPESLLDVSKIHLERIIGVEDRVRADIWVSSRGCLRGLGLGCVGIRVVAGVVSEQRYTRDYLVCVDVTLKYPITIFRSIYLVFLIFSEVIYTPPNLEIGFESTNPQSSKVSWGYITERMPLPDSPNSIQIHTKTALSVQVTIPGIIARVKVLGFHRKLIEQVVGIIQY